MLKMLSELVRSPVFPRDEEAAHRHAEASRTAHR
jgi:hypothetical protein